MEDLPVFEKGCDSSYSWNKKFKCLQRSGTPQEIVERLTELNKSEWNPEGLFEHPKTEQFTHMVFTGGEPLMKHAQPCILEMFDEWERLQNEPKYVTFETNGTQPLSDDFLKHVFDTVTREHKQDLYPRELFFSVSPKLWSVAGEKADKAIKPEVVRQYHDTSMYGQLKFVSNGTKEAWEEIEHTVDLFRQAGVEYPVWIMAVGATVEGQEGKISGHKTAAAIADEAMERGYSVAARVHTYVYGNVIGS